MSSILQLKEYTIPKLTINFENIKMYLNGGNYGIIKR